MAAMEVDCRPGEQGVLPDAFHVKLPADLMKALHQAAVQAAADGRPAPELALEWTSAQAATVRARRRGQLSATTHAPDLGARAFAGCGRLLQLVFRGQSYVLGRMRVRLLCRPQTGACADN